MVIAFRNSETKLAIPPGNLLNLFAVSARQIVTLAAVLAESMDSTVQLLELTVLTPEFDDVSNLIENSTSTCLI